MALQNRVSRLEVIHTAQAKQQVTLQSSEEARQWLNGVVRSINERTCAPSLPAPRKFSGNSPEPIVATKQWLAEIINEIKAAKGTA